jgi:hypothetical protein
MIEEGRLSKNPKISPTKAGWIGNTAARRGIKKPSNHRSIKAELKASHFFRLFSNDIGSMIKISRIPKTNPQIIPSVILFMVVSFLQPIYYLLYSVYRNLSTKISM